MCSYMVSSIFRWGFHFMNLIAIFYQSKSVFSLLRQEYPPI